MTHDVHLIITFRLLNIAILGSDFRFEFILCLFFRRAIDDKTPQD